MTYTIKLRRGLSTEWATVNPTLAEGETGWELDTRNFKQGDGVTAWNDLEYVIDENDRLPDASGEADNRTLLTLSGDWVVGDLPSGLPDPAGETDGRLLGILSEAWTIVDPPSGGGAGGRMYTGFVSGGLGMGVGTVRIYNDSGVTQTVLSTRISVGVSPSGAPIVVDINKNGTSIYTTATKPTIPSGGVTDKAVPDAGTTLADGDFLTIDVDSIGSTVAGSNLTVQIEVA